ncbi:uracil-DNA glycosylase [Microbacterium sp. ARD31]|uniref:uracil-DNA glycosylase n=1 Tax=Microbacterium sp. ARD31 TaxID=2962576 RepID=UPI002880E4C6|nr:uracil-DNA glycosylase [Microbacterium sp. ARD31]MDT0180205.1 uracil-DNA glycosylase [Microbacterium sp. ARD31]
MSLVPELPPEWTSVLTRPSDPHWLNRLRAEIETIYSTATAAVYPHASDVFRAFELTLPDSLRVVIVGLDPYRVRDPAKPNGSVADGLAFSARGHKPPASLQTMLYNLWQSREIELPPAEGDLAPWALDQGVLLLNLSLTVQRGAQDSDRAAQRALYRELIESVLEYASSRQGDPVAFLLLGEEAKRVEASIANPLQGQVVTARHPSRSWWPSAGDTEYPFTAINEFLGPDRRVDWRL